MIAQGFVVQSDQDTDVPPTPAIATISKDDAWDHGGLALGQAAVAQGRLWTDRPYFTGNPSVDWLVQRLDRCTSAGGYAQIGNENNLPLEGWQGGPGAWFEFEDTVRQRANNPERLLSMPPSPGMPDWQSWVRPQGHHAVHAYGNLDELQAVVQWFLDNTQGDLFVTECNFAAGRAVDTNAWAWGHLMPFLDWCATQPRIRAVTYFAWVWHNPDSTLATSLDAKGTAIETVVRDWNPPTQEVPPVATNVNPPLDDLVAYARNAAGNAGFPPDVYQAQINQESGFRHWDENGELVGSSAGAQGIAQIVTSIHHVDMSTPWPSLDYAATWMGELLREYGDVIRPLIHYNGGGGAVQAWANGEPYNESVQYVDNILGFFTVPQFGGPLPGMGFPPTWVASACGPIAVAGMAYGLGINAPVDQVLNSAPSVGWTPEGGMNGPQNLETLLKIWGMTPVGIEQHLVPDRLNNGRPVIISTPKHYYLAQRGSRTDADLLVGNSGMARMGGGPWMSLAAITNLDGEINGLWCAEHGEPIDTPVPPQPPTVDPIDDAFNNLWDLTLQTEAQPEPRRQSAQAAIDVLKDALGK